MSPEETRELWSRFLSGEKLSAEAQKELVQAIDADSELRDSLLENLQLDGMLRALETTRKHGEAFVRTMTECVGAEGDATRFIEKVELRLNEPPPPTPTDAAGTGRRTKPPTTRVFRRRSAASAQGETAWKPALIAAAALVVILLLVTSPKPPPTVARPPAPKTAPEIVLPPPPPPPVEEKQKPAPPRMEAEPRSPLIPPTFPEPKPEAALKPPTPSEEKPVRPDPEAPRRPEGKVEPTVTTKADPPLIPAVLEKVELFVFCGPSNTNLPAANKGDKVPPGHEVRTKAASSAVLLYDDGTRVELAANSSLREDLPAAGRGRRVVLSHGSLESHITKQDPSRPMVFGSPTAEATIVGTTVRLTVSHDPKVGTMLEVKEGKVLFARLSDKKPVEVTTGQFAIVADGADLKPARRFPDEVLVKFGPADVQVKPGQVLDTGEEFDAARGYGWKGPKTGPILPGVIDPASGQPVRTGRYPARRSTLPNVDPLKATDVVAGWGPHFETWTMPVPNGRYLVTVCCGDAGFEQGPHHVAIEGFQIIDAKLNKAGDFLVEKAIVDVRDGELTMKVGGYAGSRVSGDGSVDTILNYLIIQRLKK